MNNIQRSELLKKICDSQGLYPVIPLTNWSKVPYSSWGDANNQYNEIFLLGKNFEWTNSLGENKRGKITGHSLMTGKISNIIVLDIDNKKGVDGTSSLKKICKDLNIDYDKLFETLVIKTPNDGYHLYFKYEVGIKNKAGYAEGIDIRSDGGIIVLPYSKLKEGKEYKIYNNQEIRDMPKELVGFFKRQNIKEIKKESNPINKKIKEGEGRNQNLISFLGKIIKSHMLREFKSVYEIAYAYSNTYHDPPLSEVEITNIVNSVLKYSLPTFFNSKGKLVTIDLVKFIKKHTPTLSCSGRQYIYDEKGFYFEMKKKEIWNFIFEQHGDIPSEYQTLARFKEAKEQLAIHTEYDSNKRVENLLNLKNGMLDLDRFELIEHDPKYYSFSQVPINFDETAMRYFENSKFKQLIMTSINEDAVPLLQEMYGLALYNNPKKFQKCFVLVGDGSNGKGVVLSVLANLVGEANISRVGIQKYNTKFENYMLENKKLNIDTDSSGTRIEESENFKKAIAGEIITVQRKGIDPIDIIPTHLHVSAMNNLPSSADKSDGFYRRFLFIDFPNKFGTEEEFKSGKCNRICDKNLLDDILENEMEIVLAWALEGLKRIRNNNYKNTRAKSSENMFDNYIAMTDSVRSFIEDALVYEITAKEFNCVLRERYEEYCIREGLPIQSQIALTKGLKRAGGIEFKSGSKRGIKNFQIK